MKHTRHVRKPPPPPLPRPVVDRMARRMAAAVTWARLCAADKAPACGPLFLRAAQRAMVRRNRAAVLAALQAEWAQGPRCAAWARAV